MDNEILEILKNMQASIQRLESKVDKLELGQQEIKADIRHIQKNNKSICQPISHHPSSAN